jgi:nitrate/TMAO reductase-like tetraheme cytochrome c subunit
MALRCTTCHQGNDPRDENPWSSATSARAGGDFTLRKMVAPEKTCLKCHGQMNYTVMGLPEPWHRSREMFQNNCLLCHANIRTVRHQVNYLNAAAIEAAGAKSSDTCYGCHGGRAWYRTNYPYARHAWPGMDPAVPDWAKGRPTESELRFVSDLLAKP